MKKLTLTSLVLALTISIANADCGKCDSGKTHPDSKDWKPLIEADMSNADAPEGVWTIEDGVFTASKDRAIWSKKAYEKLYAL